MNEPKLRFPGYTGPLKRISCGELFRERKEKGQDHLPILTLSIHTGISDHELDDTESIKKVKRSEDKSLYKRVYPNDLAFNMMRAWQGAFGVSKVDGMISPAYIVAEPIKKINADYLNYYIQTARFIGAANNLSYGVTDFRKRLYWNSFCKIEMHLPSLEEQNKIAALLVSIDNTIDKQNEMISAWEERKKGVMQKLFSQEIRFKADDGNEFPEWEERLLGDLTKLYTGRSFSDSLKENGKYVVMDMGTVTRNGFRIEKKHTDILRDVLKKNDLVMPKDDIGAGLIICKTVYIPADNKYVLGDHAYCLRFTEQNSLFMHYLINSEKINRSFKRKVTGSAQLGIKAQNIMNQLLPIPCLIEQQKIADCLSALDEVIEKQKARLVAWEELKKGLLQKMFV
jgi:type I restriction enzyme S subunit